MDNRTADISNILVCKYGGSSLATAKKIEAVAEKLIAAKQAGREVVVVVSANGDTTDQLLERARQLNPMPSGRELDLLLSSGEQISSAFMAMAIQQRGHRAVALTGRQCGIYTDGRHGGATITEVHPLRIREELKQGNIVVVTGYQGLSASGELTTLGRGGSDTTAIAVASALAAPCCEIYSDVDGVYSADPRVVSMARRLDHIDYDSMIELSRQGAAVLNQRAVEYARRQQMVIHARSAFTDGGGTVIAQEAPFAGSGRGALAVAGQSEVLGVHMRAQNVDVEHAICNTLSSHELIHEQRCGASDARTLFVSGENIVDAGAFAKTLHAMFGGQVEVTTGLGTVAAVGAGIGNDRDALRRARLALEQEHIAVMAFDNSAHSLMRVVAAEHVQAALQALHKELIECRWAGRSAA